MSKRKIIISIIACVFFAQFSCQSQRGNDKEINKPLNEGNMFISKLLEKQLRLGVNKGEWKKEDITKQDLEASLELIDSLLISNGYQKPLNFDKKVEDIFHLGGDNKTKDPMLLTFGSSDGSFDPRYSSGLDPDKELLYSVMDGDKGEDAENLYLSKKLKFISPFYMLPLLVDYQKEYPSLVQIEQESSFGATKKIKKWSDIPKVSVKRKEIVSRIISLNKYLFDDDKSQLMYLWANDSTIMKALLDNYGYTKDENLLGLSLQYYSGDISGYGNNGYKDLGVIVFSKNEWHPLEIREDILKYIQKVTTKDDGRLYYAMYSFAMDLINGKITKDDGGQKYNVAEKRKIIAYIANYNDEIFETFGLNNVELPAAQKYPLLAYLFHKDPDALEEFKKQNYYGLSRLKELTDFADGFSNIVN